MSASPFYLVLILLALASAQRDGKLVFQGHQRIDCSLLEEMVHCANGTTPGMVAEIDFVDSDSRKVLNLRYIPIPSITFLQSYLCFCDTPPPGKSKCDLKSTVGEACGLLRNFEANFFKLAFFDSGRVVSIASMERITSCLSSRVDFPRLFLVGSGVVVNGPEVDCSRYDDDELTELTHGDLHPSTATTSSVSTNAGEITTEHSTEPVVVSSTKISTEPGIELPAKISIEPSSEATSRISVEPDRFTIIIPGSRNETDTTLPSSKERIVDNFAFQLFVGLAASFFGLAVVECCMYAKRKVDPLDDLESRRSRSGSSISLPGRRQRDRLRASRYR